MTAGGVVVIGPGSAPSIRPIADSIARVGRLKSFVTPFAVSEAEIACARRLSPGCAARRVESELRRRRLPEHVRRDEVVHAGSLPEVAATLALRAGGPAQVREWLIDARSRRVDATAARQLATGDWALVSQVGAGSRALRRARSLGVTTYLECPTAHHRVAARILGDEIGRSPAWAATLQYHALSRRQTSRLDEDIASAHRLIVLSNFARETYLEAGCSPEQILVNPLGVDLQAFTPRQRQPDGIFRILFAGQLTQRKGLSDLVDGFERAAIPSSELVLLGRIVGTDLPWRARPGIRHVAHLPSFALPEAFASADVFVLPSLIEGFPLTAIMAMASGRPVIVSTNTFGTDVVRNGQEGYVVPIRSPDLIAEHLTQLHSRPAARERMGAEARRRAEDFSWERFGERILRLLDIELECA